MIVVAHFARQWYCSRLSSLVKGNMWSCVSSVLAHTCLLHAFRHLRHGQTITFPSGLSSITLGNIVCSWQELLPALFY